LLSFLFSLLKSGCIAIDWKFIPGKKIFETDTFKSGCIAIDWKFIPGKKYLRQTPFNLVVSSWAGSSSLGKNI